VRQLSAIAQAMPAPEILQEETACPAALEQARPYTLVDAAYFDQFSPSGFHPEDPAGQPRYRLAQDQERRGVWFRGEDFTLIAQSMAATPRDDHALAKGYAGIVARGEGRGLVVVVHTIDERLPRLLEASAPDDVVIAPAAFEGWALVFDPRTAELQCQVRVSAKSSRGLSFAEGQDPLRVAFADYQRSFSNAIESAFERRGAQLERYVWR
jgi:hypothetical protein